MAFGKRISLALPLMQSDQGNPTNSVGDEELQLLSSMFCDELHAVRPCGAGKELELLLPHGVVIVVLIPFGYPQECPSVRVQRGPSEAFCEVLQQMLGSILDREYAPGMTVLVSFVQQALESVQGMMQNAGSLPLHEKHPTACDVDGTAVDEGNEAEESQEEDSSETDDGNSMAASSFRPPSFESLPYDCVFTVLRFLLPNQTVDFARCSQRCYSLATDDGVWCEYWQRYNPSHFDVRSVRTQIPWSYRWSYLLEILDLQWSIGLYAKDIPHRCARFARAITKSIPDAGGMTPSDQEEFKEMINAKRDQVTALAWNDLYYRTTHQHAKEWAHIQVNMLTGNYYTGLKLAESFPFQEVDPRIARLLRMPGDEESIRAFIRKYDVLSLSSREGAEVDAVLSSVPRKQIFTAVTLATNEGEGMEFQRSNSFEEDSKECQRMKQPRKKERKMRKLLNAAKTKKQVEAVVNPQRKKGTLWKNRD